MLRGERLYVRVGALHGGKCEQLVPAPFVLDEESLSNAGWISLTFQVPHAMRGNSRVEMSSVVVLACFHPEEPLFPGTLS